LPLDRAVARRLRWSHGYRPDRPHLRRLRERRGLTQEALEQKAQIHRITVIKIEVGRMMPTVPMLGKLADALGVSVAALLR
jgi:transcriptional regulator with XRE-family HTH domain